MKNLLLIGLLLLTACSSDRDGSHQVSNNEPQTHQPTKVAKNSNWFGTYEGVVPCGDCSGIKTRLILNNDNSYSLTEEYQSSRSNNNFVKNVGTFSVNSNNSSLITLDDSGNNRVFFIGKDFVELREIGTGNKIKGNSNYTLKKIPE